MLDHRNTEHMKVILFTLMKDIDFYIRCRDGVIGDSYTFDVAEDNIIFYLDYYYLPEDTLEYILGLKNIYFNLDISIYQDLSKGFITNHCDELMLDELLDNPSIPQNIKDYIRMFL